MGLALAGYSSRLQTDNALAYVPFTECNAIFSCSVHTVAPQRALVKANSQRIGKGHISTPPCRSQTFDRILMKPRIYNYVAVVTTHADPCCDNAGGLGEHVFCLLAIKSTFFSRSRRAGMSERTWTIYIDTVTSFPVFRPQFHPRMGDALLFGPAVTVYVERNVEICMMFSLFDSVACGTLRYVAARCGTLLRKGVTDDVNAT